MDNRPHRLWRIESLPLLHVLPIQATQEVHQNTTRQRLPTPRDIVETALPVLPAEDVLELQAPRAKRVPTSPHVRDLQVHQARGQQVWWMHGAVRERGD